MTTAAPTVRVGVYDDLPEADYHADLSLSSSGVRKLLPPHCPARFAYEREHGQAPKRTFDIGKAAHRYVLGVGAELRVLDFDSYRSNAAKAEQAKAYAEGAVPLLPPEHEQVLAMAAAIQAHPRAGKLFTPGRGVPEQSLFWTDQRTGVPCRARLDWSVRTSRRLIIVDYKTADSADATAFERDHYRYGYFIQAPWYCAGADAVGLAGDDEPGFVFVVQEKEPPYLVATYQPDAESIRAGRREAREAIRIFAECTETGVWPGYDDGGEIPYVSLPPWAARQYEQGAFL